MEHFVGPKSCIAGVDLGRGVRVKLDTTKSTSFKLTVIPADAADDYIGWTEEGGVAGEAVAIILRGAGGILPLATDDAVTIGAKIYPAAAGKHTITGTTGALAIAVGTKKGGAAEAVLI